MSSAVYIMSSTVDIQCVVSLLMDQATGACEVDRPVAPMSHWRTPDGRLLRDIYNETYSPTWTGH